MSILLGMPSTRIVLAAVVVVLVVVVGALAFLFLAPGGPLAPRAIKLGLFISNLGNPYFVALRDGAEAAVMEIEVPGGSIEMVVHDAKDDPSLQVSQIETATGISAVLVNPVHKEAIQPALERVIEAGVPVITTDRDVANPSLRLVFIGTDNVAGAEQAARSLVEALERSGKEPPWRVVILNGIPGTTAAEDRRRGFRNVLDALVGEGRVVIVAEEVANFRRDQGLSVMESILAREEVDAVIAANDEMALGAIQAIEGAGLRPGVDVIIVGYDAIPDAVDAVREGKMYATIAQSPFLQGYWAVYAAYYHLTKGWRPETDWIPTPTVVVTRANVDTFQSEVASPRPLPGSPSE